MSFLLATEEQHGACHGGVLPYGAEAFDEPSLLLQKDFGSSDTLFRQGKQLRYIARHGNTVPGGVARPMSDLSAFYGLKGR